MQRVHIRYYVRFLKIFRTSWQPYIPCCPSFFSFSYPIGFRAKHFTVHDAKTQCANMSELTSHHCLKLYLFIYFSFGPPLHQLLVQQTRDICRVWRYVRRYMITLDLGFSLLSTIILSLSSSKLMFRGVRMCDLKVAKCVWYILKLYSTVITISRFSITTFASIARAKFLNSCNGRAFINFIFS